MATEQRELTFSGNVQGVGFRATTRHIANGLAVEGYVMNLADGRVRLVAEGDPAELDLLEKQVANRMDRNIDHTDRDVRPATGQYAGFEIRF